MKEQLKLQIEQKELDKSFIKDIEDYDDKKELRDTNAVKDFANSPMGQRFLNKPDEPYRGI